MSTISLRDTALSIKKQIQNKQSSHQLPLPLLIGQDNKYSYVIAAYSSMPRFNHGKVKRIDGRFTESLKTTNYRFGDIIYSSIEVQPARIRDSEGIERDYLPGEKERHIEEGIIKLASSGKGFYVQGLAGVIFKKGTLQKLLKDHGHCYSYQQITEGIKICGGSILKITPKNEKTMTMSFFSSTIYGEEEANQDDDIFVLFNPIVTKKIEEKEVRQLNYQKHTQLKNMYAVWLHTQMALRFRQASYLKNYTPSLRTIMNGVGAKEFERLSDNLKHLKIGLEELKEHNILRGYEITNIMNGRKLMDADTVLKPHKEFIGETKYANKQETKFKSLKKIIEMKKMAENKGDKALAEHLVKLLAEHTNMN